MRIHFLHLFAKLSSTPSFFRPEVTLANLLPEFTLTNISVFLSQML